MAKQGALSARLPVPSDSEDSHHSFNSEPAMPVSRHQSAKSRMGEATPLMLDVPGHFRDLPMFMDTAVRMKSGRWKAMMEAVVSKVFWDGFFWERGAYVAQQIGEGDSTMVSVAQRPLNCIRGSADPSGARKTYFLFTGLGAAFGVFLGQWLYGVVFYLLAVARAYDKAHELPTPRVILMVSEGAILLSSGAFVSGFMWQPVVNVLILLLPAPGGPFPSFLMLVLLTSAIEAFVFFAGLHLFRFLYSTLLKWEGVDAPLTEGAFEYDMTLALSVGAGAGVFVATEAYYASNFLTGWFGVYTDTPVGLGCTLAGLSMVLGFVVAQSLQNLLLPNNTSWADQRHKGQKQMRETGHDRPSYDNGEPVPYIPPHG